MPPSPTPSDPSSFQQLDTLYQRQLRQAAADVAAAIAHAVGTPLNVIGGRAELIRQDPANALAQVTRIEEQVRKLADGLRQFVEYLSPTERHASDLPAAQILADVLRLLAPIAHEHQVELATDSSALADSVIPPNALGNLFTLLSWAVRNEARLRPNGARQLVLGAASIPGGALFELKLLGLAACEGWRIDHFDAQASENVPEPYRMPAICAAVARGQGGKLQVDKLTDDDGVRIRLTCRSSPG
jgi:hypothetical protein